MKIEDELRQTLRDRAGKVRAAPDAAWERFGTRRRGPRPRERLVAATVAFAVFAAAALLVWHAFAPTRTPMREEPRPSATFARYFFSASGTGIRGVLEVASSPPSICYSTPSVGSPPVIRPISLVSSPSGQVKVTYAPTVTGDFCDKTVSRELTSDLIANPDDYRVRWQPISGGATEDSALVD